MKSLHPASSVPSSAYDQRLGQFLSPDPFVQAPENTQSFNRFAYCLNNPMKYTDPSGYRASNGNNNFYNDPSEHSASIDICNVRIWGQQLNYFKAYMIWYNTDIHNQN